MTAVLSVLSVIGLALLYILAFLVVLLLLLLFVPVSVKLRYENSEFSAVLHLLGLKLKLYPDTEQQWWHPKKSNKDKKEKTPKKTKEQAGKAAKITLGQILALVRAGGMAVKLICASLRITNIHIRLPIQGGDAATVAQKYGKTQAWLHGSLAVLNNFLYLDFKELRLDPVFDENLKIEPFCSCKISAQLFIILVVAYRLFGMLRDDEDLRAFFSKKAKVAMQM